MKPIINFDKNSNLENLMELEFIKKENDMQTLSKKILNAKSYNEVKSLCGQSPVYLMNYAMDDFIADSTICPLDEELWRKKAESVKRASNGWLKQIIKNGDKIDFIAEDDKFQIEILSKKYPFIKEWLPEIENESRYGACHNDAVVLAIMTPEECNVVTGYVSPLTDKVRYLHSWVEINSKDGEKVMDPSRNLFISKKDYYELRDIQGAVYKLSNTTIKADLKMLDYLKSKNWLYLKLYLSNRPLALSAYEKLKGQEKEQ